jgi:hypothetical protein
MAAPAMASGLVPRGLIVGAASARREVALWLRTWVGG